MGFGTGLNRPRRGASFPVMEQPRCTVCDGEVEATEIPVMIRRAGHEVTRLAVPGTVCAECGWVAVEDAARENLIATLERHSRPGDEIVFPEDTPAH